MDDFEIIKTQERMLMLYLVNTIPCVCCGSKEISYIWKSKKAEKQYNELKEFLQLRKEEETNAKIIKNTEF